jgi:hypothetical protein
MCDEKCDKTCTDVELRYKWRIKLLPRIQHPHLMMQIDPVPVRSFILGFRIPDAGQSLL